jgi:predicted membrane protein
MRYTGRKLASDAQGTSFSIGYVGDSYIDFGLPGAIGIPFLLGLIYALIARHTIVLTRRRDLAFCVALLIVVFLPAYKFEISNIKLFPTMLLRWIIAALFVWGVWPRLRQLVLAAPPPMRNFRPDARVAGRG